MRRRFVKTGGYISEQHETSFCQNERIQVQAPVLWKIAVSGKRWFQAGGQIWQTLVSSRGAEGESGALDCQLVPELCCCGNPSNRIALFRIAFLFCQQQEQPSSTNSHQDERTSPADWAGNPLYMLIHLQGGYRVRFAKREAYHQSLQHQKWKMSFVRTPTGTPNKHSLCHVEDIAHISKITNKIAVIQWK
jgi:hypothetical protein